MTEQFWLPEQPRAFNVALPVQNAACGAAQLHASPAGVARHPEAAGHVAPPNSAVVRSTSAVWPCGNRTCPVVPSGWCKVQGPLPTEGATGRPPGRYTQSNFGSAPSSTASSRMPAPQRSKGLFQRGGSDWWTGEGTFATAVLRYRQLLRDCAGHRQGMQEEMFAHALDAARRKRRQVMCLAQCWQAKWQGYTAGSASG